jgi:hypothetical protein
MDTATYIGQQVKHLMELIADIDPYLPDEDLVEVLIGSFSAWGTVEAQLLFPALEATFEGSEAVTAIARERLNTLHALQDAIHLGEGADEPFSEQALKYTDAVKYHLLLDIQELVPLASQLPDSISHELARSMADMKMDLE